MTLDLKGHAIFKNGLKPFIAVKCPFGDMMDISRWYYLGSALVLFVSSFNGFHHAGLSSSFVRLSPEVKYQLTVKYFKELPPQTNR